MASSPSLTLSTVQDWHGDQIQLLGGVKVLFSSGSRQNTVTSFPPLMDLSLLSPSHFLLPSRCEEDAGAAHPSPAGGVATRAVLAGEALLRGGTGAACTS